MHTIKIDVSNTIFDNVMFILNNLPKSEVKFWVDDKPKETLSKKDSLVDFFQNSPLVGVISLEQEKEIYKSRIEF